MIVITLLVIYAGIAFPKFKNTFYGLQLKNAAFNIYKLFYYARERAVSDGEDTQLRFNYDLGRIQFYQWNPKAKDPLTDEPKPDFYPGRGRAEKSMLMPETLVLRGSHSEFTCHPDGNCDTGKIQLSNGLDKYEIEISGLGAKIEVREIE